MPHNASATYFAVNGKTLADIDLFAGWTNCDALLKKHGPTWLLNQVDGH